MQDKEIKIHSQLFDGWVNMIQNKRFPHTVLLSGKTGYGSLWLAWQLAGRILCPENDEKCIQAVKFLHHPDLHFIFPTATGKKVSKDPSSKDYMNEWNGFLQRYPFASYSDWMTEMGAPDKKGEIRVKDAMELVRQSGTFPVQSQSKVFIIWLAEKMNLNAANKLLKLLEEPPGDTYFILITENERQILPTILSRCLIFQIPKISNAEIKENLTKLFILQPEKAMEIANRAQGNWHTAVQLLNDEDPNKDFKEKFVHWVRIAYKAKNDPQAILSLQKWAEELASEGNAYRVNFLHFTLEVFRQAYFLNRNFPGLSYIRFEEQKFDPQKFAPFVHQKNIQDFYQLINDAIYHLNRNANPKLTFMDLSIKLTRLLHKPAS